jgi:hypothetical protein
MAEHIRLPKLAYFTQKNLRIGSVTPEDLVAHPLEPIFQYRVRVQDDRLRAEYYIDSKCYELTDKEKITVQTFDVSPDGIRAAEDWLEDAYRVFERSVGY